MDIKFGKELLKEVDVVVKKVLDKKFTNPKYPKDFDIEDYVILGLFDGIVSRFDSILYLAEADKFFGIEAIARGILEAHAYLIYILEKDTVKRSKAYFYSVKKKELDIYNGIIAEDVEGIELRRFLNISKEKFIEEFEDKANEMHEKIIKHIGIKKKNWYQSEKGNNNFRELCESLGLGEEHYLLFKLFSTETHAKDGGKQFVFEEADEGISSIYIIEKNIEHVITYCSLTLIELTRKLYKYYGLDRERKLFNQKIEFKYKFKGGIKLKGNY
ncbi:MULTISPECIES: DUF5677 domain-containing protein [Lysinibacillus]|uniref:DUF5677 domain-containing protein n=1 Tax=Lysinibacillus TaxID=400634 RepID=UPI00237DCD0E|nr:DUF5677 domain-containing protein [Lysinibacillus sp. G01H]WDU80940.1 DUF5677 domain-containing protein [Lysinibacillus sp. G01H]